MPRCWNLQFVKKHLRHVAIKVLAGMNNLFFYLVLKFRLDSPRDGSSFDELGTSTQYGNDLHGVLALTALDSASTTSRMSTSDRFGLIGRLMTSCATVSPTGKRAFASETAGCLFSGIG
jgi:hypothetical protein